MAAAAVVLGCVMTCGRVDPCIVINIPISFPGGQSPELLFLAMMMLMMINCEGVKTVAGGNIDNKKRQEIEAGMRSAQVPVLLCQGNRSPNCAMRHRAHNPDRYFLLYLYYQVLPLSLELSF